MEVGENVPESNHPSNHRKKSFHLLMLSAMVNDAIILVNKLTLYSNILIIIHGNFSRGEITIIEMPRQLCAFEAPVVSRNFKI